MPNAAPVGHERTPVAELSLYQLSDDPYPALARMRARHPVAWLPETGMWLVTRRSSVIEVLQSPDRFSTDHPGSPIQDIFGRQMLSTEGEEQKRYKAACIRPFAKRAVLDHARPLVESKADRLILAVEWRGKADLRQALTSPLSVYSVATVLGIPEELHPTILSWYDRFARALANFTADAEARVQGQVAAAEFRAAMMPLLRRAAMDPATSLFASLLHAADRLSDDAILSNALIVLFGGIETTDSMLANAIWAILRHPDQLAKLLADPTLWPRAIEESLRWEPAVQSCTRHATVDLSLDGVSIRAGDVVQCMLGAANRDPEHFDEPDRFNLARPNAQDHLSFGLGRHLCLGAHLARLEGAIALPMLFDRLPDLRFDPEHPSRPTGYEFRKPPTLVLRWTT